MTLLTIPLAKKSLLPEGTINIASLVTMVMLYYTYEKTIRKYFLIEKNKVS